jgi:MFS family permease
VPPASTATHRRALTLACLAVLLAAADTYVVVLVLPNIMGSVGLTTDQLQKATPIVSGFLLGYVALLPLVGRLSDLYGRRPVLVACLVGFAAGSAVTAGSHDLAAIVIGRFLQGLGGGGLVPVTLALVADLWPADRRSLPLGVVGAVQELGSLIGPLYGAALVAAGGWRTIFWVNLAAGVALAALIPSTDAARGPVRRPRDLPGSALLALSCAGGLVLLLQPPALAESVRYGDLVVPLTRGHWWSAGTEPVALATLAAAVLLALRLLSAAHPLVPVRRLPAVLRSADFAGALLLAGALGCVIVMFSATDPTRHALATGWPWLSAAAVVLTGALVCRERYAPAPLLDRAALANPVAIGAMLTSLAVGAGLIVALVDVPLFARATRFPDSQLDAALVLVRFLVGVPVGAVVGGAVAERLGYRLTASTGMAIATGGFVAMAGWASDALPAHGLAMSDVALVGCGLGFGLAIAPVNAAALRAVPARVHGLAGALVVLARTVGMLVGISALTALGLRAFSRSLTSLGTPDRLCPATPTSCPAWDHAAKAALVHELHVIFAGAAGCTAAAAVLAGLTLRRGGPAALRAGSGHPARRSGRPRLSP